MHVSSQKDPFFIASVKALCVKIVAEALHKAKPYYHAICSYVILSLTEPHYATQLNLYGFRNVELHKAVLRTILPSLFLNTFRVRLNLVLQSKYRKYTNIIFTADRTIQSCQDLPAAKVLEIRGKTFDYPLYVKITRYPHTIDGLYVFKGDYLHKEFHKYQG